MLLFDRAATTKQIVARWIVAAVIALAVGMMGTLIVQMCMLAPERTIWVGGFVLIMFAFFWAMANSHDEQE